MGTEFLLGTMVGYTKAGIRWTKNTVMESIPGLTVGGMKAIGPMVSNMGKVSTYRQKEL